MDEQFCTRHSTYHYGPCLDCHSTSLMTALVPQWHAYEDDDLERQIERLLTEVR
jgi:hypothetical protein